MEPITAEDIARVTHEANRAWCAVLNDYTQVEWDVAPEWQADSALNGVEGILEGRITAPEQFHEGWLAEKQAAGWTYGAKKDPGAKTHPCMVPFDQLPAEQQAKDRLFFAIVKVLAPMVQGV